jgi:hypothetical protein
VRPLQGNRPRVLVGGTPHLTGQESSARMAWELARGSAGRTSVRQVVMPQLFCPPDRRQ